MRVRAAVWCVSAALALAACGDGIDERFTGAPDTSPAPATTTTTPAKRPTISITLNPLDTHSTSRDRPFAGFNGAVRLAKHSWVAFGVESDADFTQFEGSAVWRSDDLLAWTRSGAALGAADGEQDIVAALAVGSRLVAVGHEFRQQDKTFKADAVAWTSLDGGATWKQSRLTRDAIVRGVVDIDGTLWAWGSVYKDEHAADALLWRSTDRGTTWTTLTPASTGAQGMPKGPLGTIDSLITDGHDLLAIGTDKATDPARDMRVDATVPLAISRAEPRSAVDVAVWRSADGGDTWDPVPLANLTGRGGAQLVAEAFMIGDQLVLAGADGYGGDFITTVWTCGKANFSCTAHALSTASRRAVAPAATDLPFQPLEGWNGHAANQNGLVTMVATTQGVTDGGESVYVFDPASGVTASKVLGPGTIQGVEQLVPDDNSLMAFGQREDGDNVAVAIVQLTIALAPAK